MWGDFCVVCFCFGVVSLGGNELASFETGQRKGGGCWGGLRRGERVENRGAWTGEVGGGGGVWIF